MRRFITRDSCEFALSCLLAIEIDLSDFGAFIKLGGKKRGECVGKAETHKTIEKKTHFDLILIIGCARRETELEELIALHILLLRFSQRRTQIASAASFDPRAHFS